MSQMSYKRCLSHAFSRAHAQTAIVSASAELSATRPDVIDFQSTRFPKKNEHCPKVDMPLRASFSDESTSALVSGTYVVLSLALPGVLTTTGKFESEIGYRLKISPSPGYFFKYPKIRMICFQSFSEGAAMYWAHL